MKRTKPWRAVVEKREAYINNSSLVPCSELDFVLAVLKHDSSEFDYNIVASIREVIACESKIPVEYIYAHEKCKIYSDLMGLDTFWSYYLTPIFGLMGFDSTSFLFRLEYLFESKTGHSITLNKSAYQALSLFNQKDFNVKEWILELIEKIAH